MTSRMFFLNKNKKNIKEFYNNIRISYICVYKIFISANLLLFCSNHFNLQNV